MGNIIYSKKHFRIYKMSNNSYIVHNTHKSFKLGHTHINNYNTAKYIIDMALYSLIPRKKISSYIMESIIRISNDLKYITVLKQTVW